MEEIENNSQQNLIIEINDNQRQDNQEESNSEKEKDKDASEENKEMEIKDNQEQTTEESNLETDLNNNSYRKEESEPSISDLDKLLDENNNNNNTFDQRRLSLKIKNLKDIFESKEKIDNIEKLNRKFSLITEENKPKENKPEINRRLDHRNTMKIQSFKRNSIKDLTEMFDISKGLKPIIEEKKK